MAGPNRARRRPVQAMGLFDTPGKTPLAGLTQLADCIEPAARRCADRAGSSGGKNPAAGRSTVRKSVRYDSSSQGRAISQHAGRGGEQECAGFRAVGVEGRFDDLLRAREPAGWAHRATQRTRLLSIGHAGPTKRGQMLASEREVCRRPSRCKPGQRAPSTLRPHSGRAAGNGTPWKMMSRSCWARSRGYEKRRVLASPWSPSGVKAT